MNPKTFYRNTEMCRVCPRTVNLTNLYDSENKTVCQNLKLIVYIENEDMTLLPKFICQICKNLLKNFMDFKTQCEERDKEMRENIRIKLALKDETLEISDVDENNEIEVQKKQCIIESLSDEEETAMNFDNEDEEEDMVEEYVNNSNKPDDKTAILLNQLKDRESEGVYNELKQILESIPVTKTVQTINGDASFETARKCREHVNNYNCIFCNKKFLSVTELNAHKNADHKQCTKCLKEFSTYRSMRDHFRKVHIRIAPKEGNENFPCKLCGRIFKLKSSIAKHVRSFHNKELLHHCEVCGKGFFEIGQFKAHKLAHTDERPVFCDIADCGKTFKSLDHLRIHKVWHLPREERKVRGKVNNKSEEAFICSYCGKVLQTKMSLNLHLNIHTNEKNYECKICHTKFRNPGSLNNHKLIHTNEKPHSCDLCNLSFRQKTHLRTHQLVHQDEKKFSCQLCGMSTKHKNNLSAHMRNVHLAERNHQCELCEEQYFSKNLLKKHMLNKHKDVQLNVN